MYYAYWVWKTKTRDNLSHAMWLLNWDVTTETLH